MHIDHAAVRDSTVSRRSVLLGASAVGLLGLPTHGRERRIAHRTVGHAAKARNLIMLVSDGMSMGTLTLGDHFLSKASGRPHGQGSAWLGLLNRPGVRTGLGSTHSADSVVTDSAAAATAWSVGQKVNNGALSVLPDGGEPMPLLLHAKAAGKATGVVTTTRVTHATPAAFYANVPDRDREDIVAAQLFERGIDVVLGGGAKFCEPALEPARSRGAQVVRTASELRDLPARGPVVGLFDPSHMPYVLDRDERHPGLPELADNALARLASNPGGFVLQIEAGRVDHAAHNNDAAALIADQIEFERTIDLVTRWALSRDDTLVVITSDHGNANPGCAFYKQSADQKLARIPAVRRSHDWFFAELQRRSEDRSVSPELVRAVTGEAFGIALEDREIEMLIASIVDRERVDPFGPANTPTAVLGSVLANHHGISFMSVHHTSDLVPTTAFGPGSEALASMHDNTDLFALAVEALSLTAAAGR